MVERKKRLVDKYYVFYREFILEYCTDLFGGIAVGLKRLHRYTIFNTEQSYKRFDYGIQQIINCGFISKRYDSGPVFF